MLKIDTKIFLLQILMNQNVDNIFKITHLTLFLFLGIQNETKPVPDLQTKFFGND